MFSIRKKLESELFPQLNHQKRVLDRSLKQQDESFDEPYEIKRKKQKTDRKQSEVEGSSALNNSIYSNVSNDSLDLSNSSASSKSRFNSDN